MINQEIVTANQIRYRRYPNFPSQFVAARNVDVWCPPGYSEQLDRRYPVIYMHDGQNLFDPALAYAGVTWGVAETLTRLADEKFREAIVVGIWNNGEERRREYMPQKPLDDPAAIDLKAEYLAQQKGEPVSDYYLRFIVEELKRFIDCNYQTQPDRANTIVIGSSMGGLISLYALVEYPEIFGKAACLSTHWTIGGTLLVDYLGNALPRSGQHKLYFDYGTLGLDSDYEPYQQRMDKWLQAAGYVQNQDCLTLKFEGEEHSEHAWKTRLDIPLRFLLGNSL
jgi:predicted alpha/beta superfamily hydrolase